MAWPGGSWGSVDAAFAALPIGFAQLEFLQLAGGRQRQLAAELHRARALVARDAFAAVGDDLGLGQRLALARDDHGVHALAPAFVGHADDGAHGDLGQLGDGVLDLGRVHVLAAADDHVLEPVHDEEVAVGIQPAHVARVHPAVLERGGCLGGPVPVALHDHGAACRDLAHLAGRQLAALAIDDAHLGNGHGPAGRAQQALTLRAGAVLGRAHGHDGGRQLGHAVGLGEVGAGQ